jgi:hypothetical protein
MQAWHIYMQEFRERGERAAAQPFGREHALAEAAHEAYRTTADRLTREHGWGDEKTLVILRGFNAAVQDWAGQDAADMDELGRTLARVETEFTGKPATERGT